ncbi:MAG: Ig-like domain-containing protein [Candidatus Manganitrophus sp.]|nr:Ig-like domain-containing protein [Candidatus Manganitrophus sp.]
MPPLPMSAGFSPPAGLPDITPPLLSEQQPGGDGISVRSLITVTFNEPIKPETLSGNFIVSSNQGRLPGQISYDARALQAFFNPSGPRLEYSTTYTVLFTQGIEDLAGNRLAQVSWTFTTIDPPRRGSDVSRRAGGLDRSTSSHSGRFFS